MTSRSLIDAIVHVADVPALIAHFAANAPQHLNASATAIIGFDRTPTVIMGAAALTYVRLTEAEADTWRATPGTTVLAEAPFTGTATADALFAAIDADPAAKTLYDAVWPRTPVQVSDGAGGTMMQTPPARFGVMAA